MRYLRFPQLKLLYGIPYSRMHIDRLEKAGRFPKRVKLSENCVAWIDSEIQAWSQAKNSARAAVAA